MRKLLYILLLLTPVFAKAQIGVYTTLRTKGDTIVKDSAATFGRMLIPRDKPYSASFINRAGWLDFNFGGKSLRVWDGTISRIYKDSLYYSTLFGNYVDLTNAQTITAPKTFTHAAGTTPLRIAATTGAIGGLGYYRDASARWLVYMDGTAESGTTGGALHFAPRSTGGADLGDALTIGRDKISTFTVSPIVPLTGMLFGRGSGAVSIAVSGTDIKTVNSTSILGSGNISVGTVTSAGGTTNRITVATGSTTPVIDISSSYVGQASITTLGTIGTGTWQGTAIGDTYISSATTWNAKANSVSPSFTGSPRAANLSISGGGQLAMEYNSTTPSSNALYFIDLVNSRSQTITSRGLLPYSSVYFLPNNPNVGHQDTIATQGYVSTHLPISGTGSFIGDAVTTDFVINHSLGSAPTRIGVTATNAASAAALSLGWYISAKTSTTFTVTFLTAPIAGTGNITYTAFP